MPSSDDRDCLVDGDAEAWGVPDGTPVATLPGTYQEWLEEGTT
jgi:hypothetical protein